MIIWISCTISKCIVLNHHYILCDKWLYTTLVLFGSVCLPCLVLVATLDRSRRMLCLSLFKNFIVFCLYNTSCIIESVEQFKEHWVIYLLEQDVLTTAVLFYFVFCLIPVLLWPYLASDSWPPISDFWVLGLQPYATMPSWVHDDDILILLSNILLWNNFWHKEWENNTKNICISFIFQILVSDVKLLKRVPKPMKYHQNIVLSVLASLRSDMWWWNSAKHMLPTPKL